MLVLAYCVRKKMIDKIPVSPEDVAQEVISTGHSWRVKSRGDSMYPLIKHGDTLLIEPLSASELNKGDIVFYRLPSGSFVAHRFIKRNPSGLLLTNGDSGRDYDEPVAAEQVFGRVAQIEHSGKALKLTGKLYNLNTRLITLLARHRVPLQITMKKFLGRVQWLAGLRRLA